MSKSEEKIEQLQIRLGHLEKYEAAFKREIADIRREIGLLRAAPKPTVSTPEKPDSTPETRQQEPPARKAPPQRPEASKLGTAHSKRTVSIESDVIPVGHEKSNIEQFVGTYLISIIGILVTVIGVGIGAKYAIDNDLISPLMRIVFGYAVGIALTGFAIGLRKKYPAFSSVLFSGGMAILYFITYFAHSFYSLIPQPAAFAIMVVLTFITVGMAVYENRQVIAHIGLVGAYAIPFLLSKDSGQVEILFSYIAIINIGILAVSVRKYWISLFFSSFGFTWLIYLGWYVSDYKTEQHFELALSFLTVFFATFYASFLIYKLLRKLPLEISNVSLILINSLLYFGLFYAVLEVSEYSKLNGLFTIALAFTHFGVAAVISKYDLGDKSSFYLAVVLSLVFFTIAVPVQLDGNWIAMAWIAEATFLFVIGRIRRIPVFQYSSFPLMVFSAVSLWNDWESAARMSVTTESATLPFYNEAFLTSLVVAIGFGAICIVNRMERFRSKRDDSVFLVLSILVPIAFLVALYNTFRIEIANYFDYQIFQLSEQTRPSTAGRDLESDSLGLFSVIWQLNYTILFLTILSYINNTKIRSAALGFTNLALNLFVVLSTLIAGLFTLGLIRDNFLNPESTMGYGLGIYHIVIRYFVFVFVAGLFAASHKYIDADFITALIPSKALKIAFELLLAFTALVVLSNELIHWTDIFRIDESSKFGMSVLWGLYSVSLLVIGIVYRKQHLRLFAVALLGITVIKLFFYDMSELGTISKTVAFVAVGFLLLIASFLYNKYTKQIFGERES